LGLTALVLPVYQKRAQVIELQPQVNVAAQQAQAADSLHQQLERAQNEYNFLLQKRYAAPTSLQLLNEVTRILPDDTWLQNFELRTTSKGKELQLQGETGVAGKMIELFEQSPLVSGASFKSPVTQAPGSQGSRFHIGMDVKDVAPPSPLVS
jgi:general secretion pathway protein L